MPFEREGVSHIDTDELKQMLEDDHNQTILIDVREPEEYIEGHVPGVPLIPMGDIPAASESMDPSAEYVFICRSGSRSFNVARYMQQRGFDRVHNFAGGMLVWDGEIAVGEEHVPDSYSVEALKRKK